MSKRSAEISTDASEGGDGSSKKTKMTPTSTSSGAATVSPDNESDSQKQQSKDAIAEELMCPITLELPFDPVTAEDGRVYERAAIRKHIDSNPDDLKSPMTNEPMGPRLLANPQTKNVIEHSINSGVISGDLAKSWLEKKDWKNKLEAWKKEAREGNGTSAANAATVYAEGKHGIEIDLMEAGKWWEIAANAGNTDGLVMYGAALVYNDASDEQKCHGISMMSEAAGRGCKCSSLFLGQFYAEGGHGVAQNDVRAVRFLRYGLSEEMEPSGSRCVSLNRTGDFFKRSENILQTVLARMPAGSQGSRTNVD